MRISAADDLQGAPPDFDPVAGHQRPSAMALHLPVHLHLPTLDERFRLSATIHHLRPLQE